MERPEHRPAAEDGDPLVSVITVNYNGFELLANLLESLRGQTYAKHEVVVVDNASSDGSVDLLRRRFPEVRVLQQSENVGFAAANNAGIRASKGDLIALANNDTVADPTWLEWLMRTALADPGVAAVGSKILFLRPFLRVHLSLEDAAPPGGACERDPRGLEALFGEETSFLGCDYHKPIFREGFRGSELSEGRRVRRMAADATVLLPIAGGDGGARLRLVASGREHAPTRLRVEIGSRLAGTVELEERLHEFLIDVPAEVVEADSFDLINNAGTALPSSGETADRGIYEPDRGQLDREEDLEAVCGAAVLFRRSALEDVGLFDRDFFMYYEDTDLSWRLRSRGYRLRYQPRSTIRHVHAASSVEWSPLFNFYTARNRLLMIAKNGGAGVFLHAYARELARLVRRLARRWGSPRGPGAARDRAELATRLRVHRSLLVQIPRALGKRAGLFADRLR